MRKYIILKKYIIRDKKVLKYIEYIISRCLNKYNSHYFSRKLIPLIISRTLNDENLKLYTKGTHFLKLHVNDYCVSTYSQKSENKLKWNPTDIFDTGIYQTIQWYLKNKQLWENIISGKYENYF